MKYRPRNDCVLVRIIDKGHVRGIAVSDTSIHGKEFIVEAIGPQVDGLEIGDKVFMTGIQGEDYAPLPNDKTLMLIKQSNILVIVDED